MGEEGQVFRLRRQIPVPLGICDRPDGLRIELRPGQVRHAHRDEARREPLARQGHQGLVFPPGREERGCAGIHGPAALAGLAVRGWLETAYYLLGADFTASSDSGSLSYMAAWAAGGSWITASTSPPALGLASIGIRLLSQLLGPDEHRPARDGPRILVPGDGKRRRFGLAVHDRQIRAGLDPQRCPARRMALRRRDRPGIWGRACGPRPRS